MNLVLLRLSEVDFRGRVLIDGRRARHVIEVLRAKPQDKFQAGILDGPIGEAEVLKVFNDGRVEFQFEPLREAPPPLPVTLVLALPRPKVLKRVIAAAASMGVKQIVLLNAFRVEKPYWSSEQIKPASLYEACVLGLEQGCDTILPEIRLATLFKPFVQDRLPEMIAGRRAFVAHPGVEVEAPAGISEPMVLVIGPEGGFIDYEIDLLKTAGCLPVRLGERILKVETAIPYLLGRLGVAGNERDTR